MKLISLVENSSCHPDCGCIHGLSLYLETPKHRILFDMGPNALFLENAQVLGVDLSAVDLAVLSHGHYDHGGGLELFCKRNETAPILIAEHAFDAHAIRVEDGYEDIGIPAALQGKWSERIRTRSGPVDSELYLLTEISDREYLTAASATLLERTGEEFASDRFLHEQSLIVSCEGKHVLLAGCAHRGIVNILRAGEAVIGREFDYVVSGFHLTNPGLGIDEPEALVRVVGEELLSRQKTRYITGHCTGQGPYEILREMLGGRLDTMPSGRVFVL